MMYLNSNDVTQDGAKAVYWFRKVASRGGVEAQFNLGLMYDQGVGVEQNYSEAVYWYRKAAEQGYEKVRKNYAKTRHKLKTIE